MRLCRGLAAFGLVLCVQGAAVADSAFTFAFGASTFDLDRLETKLSDAGYAPRLDVSSILGGFSGYRLTEAGLILGIEVQSSSQSVFSDESRAGVGVSTFVLQLGRTIHRTERLRVYPLIGYWQQRRQGVADPQSSKARLRRGPGSGLPQDRVEQQQYDRATRCWCRLSHSGEPRPEAEQWTVAGGPPRLQPATDGSPVEDRRRRRTRWPGYRHSGFVLPFHHRLWAHGAQTGALDHRVIVNPTVLAMAEPK